VVESSSDAVQRWRQLLITAMLQRCLHLADIIVPLFGPSSLQLSLLPSHALASCWLVSGGDE